MNFDVFVGTSTGSLIVPLAAIGDLPLLEKMYTTQTETSIVRKLRIGDRLKTDSIFDAMPLWELIQRTLTDEKFDRIQNLGKKIYLTTVCLQTEELVVFTNDKDAESKRGYEIRQIENANHFRRAMMASACQPIFMPAIQVNRDLPHHPEKNYQYIDGGVREYAGVEMAIDAGATAIFTILHSAKEPDIQQKQYGDLFSILERTIAIFISDVSKNDLVIPKLYNEALEYIQAVKNKMTREGLSKEDIDRYFYIRGRENPFENKLPLKIFTFRPDTHLGGGPGGLDFNPSDMTAMIKKGEQTGSDFIASLQPGELTWA